MTTHPNGSVDSEISSGAGRNSAAESQSVFAATWWPSSTVEPPDRIGEMRVRVPPPPFVPRHYSICHGHLSDGEYLPVIRAELVEIGSDKLGTRPHVLRIANRPPLWQQWGMWFKEPPEGQRTTGGSM